MGLLYTHLRKPSLKVRVLWQFINALDFGEGHHTHALLSGLTTNGHSQKEKRKKKKPLIVITNVGWDFFFFFF
jgi:hypothetical protein